MVFNNCLSIDLAVLPSKNSILKVFIFGYELEPKLSRWHFNSPDSVVLRRVPALSSDNWDNFAKLFYTLEAMGQLARLHWPVYDNFHFRGIKLNEEAAAAAWVAVPARAFWTA